jgi:hypothetical protein
MNLQISNFSYCATIKLSELPTCASKLAFPTVSDISLNSRAFGSYTECISSARRLMDDIAADINAHSSLQFMVSSEANPLHTGVETRSRDWAEDELSRLWLFSKIEAEARNIHATGKVSVFMVPRGDSSLN